MSSLITILKNVNFGGFIDNIIINNDIIFVKNDSNTVSVHVKIKEQLFNKKYSADEKRIAFRKISLLIKLLDLEIFENFEERENDLYFKSESGSEYFFPKADASIIPKPKLTIEQMKKEYSDDKIEFILTKEILSDIKTACKLGFDEYATFFTDESGLRFSVGSTSDPLYKTSSLCETKKMIKNSYEKRFISALMEVIPENSKFTIDYKGEAYPIFVEYELDEDYYTHIIVPVEN